jgi:hypothetical protein
VPKGSSSSLTALAVHVGTVTLTLLGVYSLVQAVRGLT